MVLQICCFAGDNAEVRPVERRDGNLRQAFRSGGAENQSHRAGAAAEMAPQFWAPSQHCSGYPLCAGICRPSSRRVICPSPARRRRSVWSGAELYQLAIGNLWSRLCQESQRVIRLNPVPIPLRISSREFHDVSSQNWEDWPRNEVPTGASALLTKSKGIPCAISWVSKGTKRLTNPHSYRAAISVLCVGHCSIISLPPLLILSCHLVPMLFFASNCHKNAHLSRPR